MKSFVLTVLCGLLASSAVAVPVEKRNAASSEISAIEHAVYTWRQDTALVSDFLNKGKNQAFKGQMQFHHAATATLAAELNELPQKAVLDKYVPHSQEIETANNTLVTEGTFGSVVSFLQQLTKLNYNTEYMQILEDVNQIDFGTNTVAGRCEAVLPAIDMYFDAAAKYVQKLGGGTSLFGVQAIRPYACPTGPYSIGGTYSKPSQ